MVLVHQVGDTISNRVLQMNQEFRGKKNDQVLGKTLILGENEKTGIATFERR